MASRYLPQQQLIGPALFPVLPPGVEARAVLGRAADRPVRRRLVGDLFRQSRPAWAQALGAAWNGAIYAIGIVTLVFAVLERERVRFTALDKWDPAMAAGGRNRPAGAAWRKRCWVWSSR